MVMRQIRERIRSGESVAELIEEGLAPSSVYKAQQQIARGGEVAIRKTNPMHIVPHKPPQPSPNLREETETLRTEKEALARELRNKQGHIERLESQLSQIPILELRSAEFEAEAKDAAQLREQVRQLGNMVERTKSSYTQMKQSAVESQSELHDERVQRIKAEQQWTAWSQKAQQMELANQALTQTVAGLQPLRAWEGFPCKKCGKPLSGVVSRKDAERIMKDFAHSECLKDESSEGSKFLLAALGIYGVAQLASRLNKQDR